MKDPRLKDHFVECDPTELQSLEASSVVILSYPDHEGVLNNGGRGGAQEGPERILYYLSRLCWRQDAEISKIYVVRNDKESFLRRSLLERYQLAEDWVTTSLQKGARVISLGGGHDYAFSDFRPFLRAGGQAVINVDAHMDVRPFDSERPNSGNAFYRLAEEFGGSFLTQWGLQSQASADDHIEFCRKKGMKLLAWDQPGPEYRRKKVGLSICLDAIAGLRGVSAPAMLGLSMQSVLQCVEFHQSSSPLLGLYEVAPSLDPMTEDSARFAAILAYRFIFGERAREGRLF